MLKKGGVDMFYHPDWILSLWLAPVFITFVLPLLVISLEWFLRPFSKTAKEMPSFVAGQPEIQLHQVSDKRQHPRLKVAGVVAHVSDGIGYCEGFLNDVSKFGLCLNISADKCDRKAEKLGVLLVGYGKYFQVQVKPKWEKCNGGEENIGAEIEDVYWDWDKFRENIEGNRQCGHAQP